jgi:hypothetical protein
MERFYVTFGPVHLGGFGDYYYLVVDAPDEMTARKGLNKQLHGGWSSIRGIPPTHNERQLGYYYVIAHRNEPDDVYVHVMLDVPNWSISQNWVVK